MSEKYKLFLDQMFKVDVRSILTANCGRTDQID
jgi:hypothetical protein